MFDTHANLLIGTVQIAPVPSTTGDTLTLMPGDGSSFEPHAGHDLPADCRRTDPLHSGDRLPNSGERRCPHPHPSHRGQHPDADQTGLAGHRECNGQDF